MRAALLLLPRPAARATHPRCQFLPLHCRWWVQVRVGTSFTDLKEVKTIELYEPTGWAVISLTPDDNPE